MEVSHGSLAPPEVRHKRQAHTRRYREPPEESRKVVESTRPAFQQGLSLDFQLFTLQRRPFVIMVSLPRPLFANYSQSPVNSHPIVSGFYCKIG